MALLRMRHRSFSLRREFVEWFRERTQQRALEAVEEEWRKLSE
jgi:hypothetical protein